MYEVEQKFHVSDPDALVAKLIDLGATEMPTQTHRDTYYNHPSRDFAETHEALRIRRVDGIPMVTYKGVKLPGAVKARRELEWRLNPGDPDGSQTEELWTLLGFRPVATVAKVRRIFELGHPFAGLTVTVDAVESVGSFAEIETLAENEADVDQARARVEGLSERLSLHHTEPRSYLRMLLACRKSSNAPDGQIGI